MTTSAKRVQKLLDDATAAGEPDEWTTPVSKDDLRDLIEAYNVLEKYEELSRSLYRAAALSEKLVASADQELLSKTNFAIDFDLPPEPCEMCGKVTDLRPYGPKKDTGNRMWVCFSCGMQDSSQVVEAFNERLRGENPV